MNNINIIINKRTRQVILPKSVIGNDGENLQENLVFSFNDEFVNGTARLELIKPHVAPSYIMLTKEDETYQLPVQSIITKGGKIDMQLVITEGTDAEEIPIFKSNQFYMIINSSINAEIEEPEEYPEWIDVANTKLNEFDNLDIDVEKVNHTATITITKKDETQEIVHIYDGEQGEQGVPGKDGKDGQDGKDGTNGTNGTNGITPTIGDNGNWFLGDTDTGKPSRGIQGETGASGQDGRDGYMQYTAGDNITIENGVISATGGGNYQPLIDNDNKLSADLIDDSSTTNQMYYVGKFSDLNTNNNLNLKLARKGIYIPDRSGGYSYYIGKLTNNNLTSSLDYTLSLIFVIKDISNMSLPSAKTYFAYAIGNSKTDGTNYFLKFYVDTAGNIKNETNTMSSHAEKILTVDAQTIDGVKTFSSIPQVSSYTAPTSDTQLVAKKYVDNKIGDINTILATLTTPGGNS